MKVLATLAVVVAGLTTTAFNWQFSYALGRNEHEALTWAIFSVALDVAKWTMLVIAARAWPSLRSLAAILIWIIAASYSFTAALGFAASSRSYHDRVAQQQDELRSALRTARRSSLWAATHSCTHVTGKPAREYCSAVRTLEAKQSNAPDGAQSLAFAHLLDLTGPAASLALSIYLAVACEIISALGLFALSTSTATRERKSSWISRFRNHRITPTDTPPCSNSAGGSTANSKNSAPPPSRNSGNGSWRKPKAWT